MLTKSFLLASLIAGSNALASTAANQFTNEDFSYVDTMARNAGTSKAIRIRDLAGKTVTCEIQTPNAYKCVIRLHEQISFSITSEELRNLPEVLRGTVSGGVRRIRLSDGTSLSCRVNTLAERPGFSCSVQ